jgi:ParB family chromosome partitioning protein
MIRHQALLKRFETIKAVFVADNHKEIALIENVQRENLNPVELAEGLAKLKEEGSYDQEGLGALIGKSAPTVSEILSINKIPDEIREEARKRKDVSQWVLVEVAKAKGPKARAKKWEQLKDSGMIQAAYRKKKKESAEKDKTQSFDFGSSMRAIRTASTQIKKLKGQEIESIDNEIKQSLHIELEILRDELDRVIRKVKVN